MKNRIGLTVILMTFIACGKSTKQHIVESEDLALVELNDDKNILLRKDDFGTYSFNNWNDFNLFNVRLHLAESKDFKVPVSTISVYTEAIENLDNTVPKWLETPELIKEIKEAQSEYEVLLEDRYKPSKKIRENWSELSEEFDDVRELLEEQIDEYLAE